MALSDGPEAGARASVPTRAPRRGPHSQEEWGQGRDPSGLRSDFDPLHGKEGMSGLLTLPGGTQPSESSWVQSSKSSLPVGIVEPDVLLTSTLEGHLVCCTYCHLKIVHCLASYPSYLCCIRGMG